MHIGATFPSAREFCVTDNTSPAKPVQHTVPSESEPVVSIAKTLHAQPDIDLRKVNQIRVELNKGALPLDLPLIAKKMLQYHRSQE